MEGEVRSRKIDLPNSKMIREIVSRRASRVAISIPKLRVSIVALLDQ